MSRCGWAVSELSIQYHDHEWGVPLHDDRKLFAFLILEGAQAGLSWETILQKRDQYHKVYDNFDPNKVSCYSIEKVEALIQDAGIVRNRRKIESSIRNASVFLKIQAEFDSFDHYLWRFTDGQPIQNCFRTLAEIPAQTSLSQMISQDLQMRGMNFVGPTIIYAFMQAVGLVNDHLVSCFRHAEIMNGQK